MNRQLLELGDGREASGLIEQSLASGGEPAHGAWSGGLEAELFRLTDEYAESEFDSGVLEVFGRVGNRWWRVHLTGYPY